MRVTMTMHLRSVPRMARMSEPARHPISPMPITHKRKARGMSSIRISPAALKRLLNTDLKAGWKIRIRLVEIREGGFRFRGKPGEVSSALGGFFFGDDFHTAS